MKTTTSSVSKKKAGKPVKKFLISLDELENHDKAMKRNYDTTQKRRQSKRIQEMQIAAERDGFTSWSEAITAWKNGEYILMKKV